MPNVKRMVLASDDQSAPRAIGPVYTDESIDKIRDEIEEAGWTCLGEAVFSSVAAFRAEIKAARPCEYCGGLESCADDCGEVAR